MKNNRAVTPVVGIILVIAITIILASVTAFVILDYSSQLDETAPQVFLDSELTKNVTISDKNNAEYDVDKIKITHESGSVLNTDDIYIESDTRFRPVQNDTLKAFVPQSEINDFFQTEDASKHLGFVINEMYQSEVPLSEFTEQDTFSSGQSITIATALSDAKEKNEEFSKIDKRLKDSNVKVTYRGESTSYILYEYN